MNSVCKYEHEAMKTSFTIRIHGSDPERAQQASLAAFERLDAIEQQLSRYIHGSDVWQINHMRSGDSLLISDECYQCLRLGLQAYMDTGGLFDPTLGTRIEHYKAKQEGTAPEIHGQLMIDPERPAVHCIQAGREVDLGGIGKGFALDRIAELLSDWKIESALVAAGASTQLAVGSQAWTIQLSGEHTSDEIEIQSEALSASGTSIQGAHILNPDPTSDSKLQHGRVWVTHPTAALADAWSTAAMLATPGEIASLKSAPTAVLYEDAEGIQRLSPKAR